MVLLRQSPLGSLMTRAMTGSRDSKVCLEGAKFLGSATGTSLETLFQTRMVFVDVNANQFE